MIYIKTSLITLLRSNQIASDPPPPPNVISKDLRKSHPWEEGLMPKNFTETLPTEIGMYCMGYQGRYVTVEIQKTEEGELAVKFPQCSDLFPLKNPVFKGTLWHGPKKLD